jgi:hypothetical protein
VINRRNASLFKKGLSENPSNGVINRRNGCGPTVAVALRRADLWAGKIAF